jgi:hypothetical protein
MFDILNQLTHSIALLKEVLALVSMNLEYRVRDYKRELLYNKLDLNVHVGRVNLV